MGACRGARGALASPLEFEKMTSYAAVPQNTLKYSLAPLALATNVLYISLNRRKKNAKIFVSVGGFAPSGKISAGAHDVDCCFVWLQT